MVYVCASRNPYGRMLMCHMLADSDTELVAMAQRIGVAARHHQYPGTPRSHFDICQSKRALAIKNGATTVSLRELAQILKEKRAAAAMSEGQEG